MQIKLTDSAYSSKFHNIIHSWDRYIIAYGGRGSGKTDSFFIKYLVSLFEPFYFRLAYINKEGSNIRDQQYAGFKRVAKRIGLYDHLKFYDGDYRIINPKNGNALIPKGMDDPEKTKGLDEVTAIWWDEVNKGDLEDFSALDELLRSPQAKYLQFAISFNPVSAEHWLRENFFSKEDPHKLKPEYIPNTLLNRSTYKDNEFIDQDAYLQTLISAAAGNSNKIRVNVEGDWGLTENGNPWLYAFDKDKHVRDNIPLKKEHPVYLSFDFNNDPVACTAWQFSPYFGHPDAWITCHNEFVGEYKIQDLCDKIRTAYPHSILHITGDRSGRNKDLGRNETLYEIIARLLKVSSRLVDTPMSNLPHSDSRMLCNTIFDAYPNVSISSVCKTLIDDCEKARVDEQTDKGSKLLKDRGTYKMDAFDSMRYFFQTYFHSKIVNNYPIFARSKHYQDERKAT